MIRFVLVLLAAALLSLPFVLVHAGMAEQIEPFGTYIAGCAALLAAIAATWKGSQEWDAWKRRKALERESEVAGRAIVAAMGLFKAMELFMPVRAIASDPKPDQVTPEDVPDMLNARLAQIADELRAFETAWYEAEAYLGDDAVAALRAFANASVAVKSKWTSYVIVTQIPAKPDKKTWKQQLCALEDVLGDLKQAMEKLKVELRVHTLGHLADGPQTWKTHIMRFERPPEWR